MRLNVTISSGAAYLLSFAAVLAFAVIVKAPFTEFWLAVASLYGWHSGRRLWRQLKTPAGVEMTCDPEPNGGETK